MWPLLKQPWYFDQPKEIAIATDGSLYVADSDNHRIQKFTSDGTFIPKWVSPGSGDGQFNLPTGIDVALDGNVANIDFWYALIL